MAAKSPSGELAGPDNHVQFVPLSYERERQRDSALALVLAAEPGWAGDEEAIELIRCTDGITNTLLKVVNRRPGLTADQVDDRAILVRAYGHGTDVIIDRQRETENHELLMRHGLAPELLCRFRNGMIYRYIRGAVASPDDLGDPAVLPAIASHLARWHATVPCLPAQPPPVPAVEDQDARRRREKISAAAPGKTPPNLWTVMQKWILALPAGTDAEVERQGLLQREFERLVGELGSRPGLGEDGLVFAHCDLLSANIIVLPRPDREGGVNGSSAHAVSFIDYEYATPSPAAFDLANHFAEWAGFDCDYGKMPSRAQRRVFVTQYVHAFHRLGGISAASKPVDADEEIKLLLDEVDLFRGVPGFYWGIWALIQAVISDIDFDYAKYAESRLGEYWAWRATQEGTIDRASPDMQLRERTWARDE